MIDKFPAFTKFSFELEQEYKSFIQDFAPYGDFSYVNLVIWLDLEDDLELSWLGKNLLMRFTNIFDSNRPKVYTLIGKDGVDDAIDLLKSWFKSRDIKQEFLYSVVEETANALTRYDPAEDRDSFDYIYSVEEQVTLLGTKFGKNRRKVNHFLRNSGEETVIREIDLTDRKEFCKLVNAMHTWEKMYALAGNDSERIEARALTRSLRYHAMLQFRCVAVIINNQIEAITLFFVNDKYSLADISHTKCSYEYKHLFDFTLFATASKLNTEGIKYISLEQDLGIAGMREHKMGLRPVKFLKKHSVDITQ